MIAGAQYSNEIARVPSHRAASGNDERHASGAAAIATSTMAAAFITRGIAASIASRGEDTALLSHWTEVPAEGAGGAPEPDGGAPPGPPPGPPFGGRGAQQRMRGGPR